MINAEPNGVNINNNAGSTHIEGLQKFVVENQCDVGFSYDGDADRCLCVDEKGNVVTGDHKDCFILAGIDAHSRLQAVDTAVEMNRNGDYGIPVPDYVEENVSIKVVKIIQSYTGVVNKMVWRK